MRIYKNEKKNEDEDDNEKRKVPPLLAKLPSSRQRAFITLPDQTE